jgi:hypothetical protein
MIKIYSPNDEIELAIIRGILDAEGIYYVIHNDHFGSLEIDPQIDLFNKKTIMVAPEDAARAKEIICDLLAHHLPEEQEKLQYSLGQKLRMVFETFLFSWFIPGRKRRKKSDS